MTELNESPKKQIVQGSVAEPDVRKVPTGVLKPVLAGFLVITVFVVGFGIWAVTAPLAGASIASGVVVASGENQAIQHLEGGIIKEISVAEGQSVEKDQPLVLLDPTIVSAERNRIERGIVGLSAQLARAESELLGHERVRFSQQLADRAGKLSDEVLLEQQSAEFASRLEQHNSELTVLEEQANAIDEELVGIKLQIEAENSKLVVVEDEIKGKKELLDKGLTPKSQYNALLRARADIQGTIGARTAAVGQRLKAISEIRQRQATLRAARKANASKEINQLRLQLEDLQEQLTARVDVLNRMVIRAPVDGIIVKITKNTIGSIIQPGETVLEILPTTDDLIISARVAPQDVDIVRVGQTASIRFVALNTRTTPEVPASVEYISADRLVDAATQQFYFDARIRLVDELPAAIRPNQIYPGMPVEAFINTGERTFLEYLVRPIRDSFNKAFREE